MKVANPDSLRSVVRRENMTTALDQLRYIDEQLAGAALPQDQAELVRVHRLTGLQLRTQRMQGG